MSTVISFLNGYTFTMFFCFGVLAILIWLTKLGLLWMFRKEYRSFTMKPENLVLQTLVRRKHYWDKKGSHYNKLTLLSLLVLGGSMFYMVHQGREIGGLDAILPIFLWWFIPAGVATIMSQQCSSCCWAIGLWYEQALEFGHIFPPPGIKGSRLSIRPC